MRSLALSISDKRELSLAFLNEQAPRSVVFKNPIARQRFYDVAMHAHFSGSSQQVAGYKHAPMRVFVASWNMGNITCPDDLSALFPTDESFDVYCFGVQEAVYKTKGGYRKDWSTDTEEWYGMLEEKLGDEYYRVGNQEMLEIKIVVFARVVHKPFIANVQTFYQPTGIGGVWYNKGGTGLTLTLFESHLCFLNCHLAAHAEQKYVLDRNNDVKSIIRSSATSEYGRKGLDLANQFDTVFWMGDMNYRIELSYEETCKQVEAATTSGNWEGLWAVDQFIKEQAEGRVLEGWNTGAHKFPPSYKYVTEKEMSKSNGETSTYRELDGKCLTQNNQPYSDYRVYTEEKGRAPSWCDRILWRSLPVGPEDDEQVAACRTVKQTLFTDVHEFGTSDHSPVVGHFTVNVPLPYIVASVEHTHRCVVWMANLSATVTQAGGQDVFIEMGADFLVTEYRTPAISRPKSSSEQKLSWEDSLEDRGEAANGKRTTGLAPMACLYTEEERLKCQYLFISIYESGSASGSVNPLGSAALCMSRFVKASAEQYNGEPLTFEAPIYLDGLGNGTVSGSVEFLWFESGQGELQETGELTEKPAHKYQPSEGLLGKDAKAVGGDRPHHIEEASVASGDSGTHVGAIAPNPTSQRQEE